MSTNDRTSTNDPTPAAKQPTADRMLVGMAAAVDGVAQEAEAITLEAQALEQEADTSRLRANRIRNDTAEPDVTRPPSGGSDG
jgi:hypothetical protein